MGVSCPAAAGVEGRRPAAVLGRSPSEKHASPSNTGLPSMVSRSGASVFKTLTKLHDRNAHGTQKCKANTHDKLEALLTRQGRAADSPETEATASLVSKQHSVKYLQTRARCSKCRVFQELEKLAAPAQGCGYDCHSRTAPRGQAAEQCQHHQC